MAPRGSKSQTAGRESRVSALRSKPSSRGGISKRKVRGDNDGDLDMDGAVRRVKPNATESTTSRARPTTRSSNTQHPRGSSRAAQAVLKHLGNGDVSALASRVTGTARRMTKPQSGGITYLRIRGLKQSKAATNADGGLSDLLSFLERKASSFNTGRQKRQVMIKKSHVAGDYVFVGASKEDAEDILKLNTFTFAGIQLEVVESNEGPGQTNKATESEETQRLRAQLQAILGQRYIGANKLLKLDALAADQTLVELGMFETRERALKSFKGLMAICDGQFKTLQEKREAIESVSLASNSIDDVVQVETLATTFPQLKNLDLSGNQLSTMQGLERWKGKFKELETLYTTGNPLETAEPNWQATLLEWFPKLQVINGTQVRTAEQIAQREAETRPKPIPQSGPDFRDVNNIGENFLLEFFTSYDNDRQGLATKLYDEGSQFSLAVDTRSVRDTDAPAPMPWAAYIKFSRNLIMINHQNARVQRLFKGSSAIHELWRTLPATRHPNIKDDLSKYIMDCHPLAGMVDPTGQNSMGVDGLIISVHGEFEEYDAKSGATGKRSFSRTFILAPGQPGRSPIRVVSDMLSLRAYSSLPNVFEAPAPSVAAHDSHQAMIAELCKQTNMVPQYSEMCLSQVDWEFDKALVIFHDKKAELPPEAFANVPR